MGSSKTSKKKTLNIVWSLRAKRDLIEIGDYIGDDNPLAARKTVARLIAAAERAAGMPFSGRIVPEYRRKDLREMICGSYRVVYAAKDNEIEIVTIFEGHRLFPDDALR